VTTVTIRPSSPDGHVGRRGGGREPVAVWDVDGTLVCGDTLLPFLRRFTGTVPLARILAGAFLRRSPDPDRRTAAKAAVVQQVLGGREIAEVDLVARRYVTDLVLPRVRPDCLRRWQWHRGQGHRLVLASASLDVYLRHLGSLLGAHEIISTGTIVVNGRLTGQLATPNCRGEQKALRVREYLAAHPGARVWVYANGVSDEPTLSLADVPVRVRPYQTLSLSSGD
jgi:phosphatidylglycerophosphatase C